jgi:hypothetical protein
MQTAKGRQMDNEDQPYAGYPRPAGPPVKPRNGMNEHPDIPRFGADEAGSF